MNLISVSLTADSSRLVRGLAIGQSAVQGFGNVVGGIERRLSALDTTVKRVGQGLVIFGGGLTAGIYSAARAAGTLQQQILNVRTIDTQLPLRNTQQQILDLTTTIPQVAESLSRGLYDIASAGQTGAQGMETLEVSAKAAAAGLSSTDIAARAIVASMNAYGDEVGSATEVSDILFQTVNLGVLTFEELANNMGDWVGTAAAAGIALDDAAAALAAMTLAGIPAFQAATSLNRVMMAFIEPSEAMTEQLAAMGYESGVAAIEALGFDGALQAIFESAGTGAEAMTAMFDNVEAARGAMALAANDGANWERTIAGITDETARAGATQRAFDTQMQGLDNRIQLMVNSFQRARIEIGEHFVPILGGLVDTGTQAFEFIGSLPEPLQMVIAAVTALSTILISLAGVLLATKLRFMLYNVVAKQFTQSTILATVAEKGLTGAILGSIPAITAKTARLTASIPVLNTFTARLNTMAGSVARAGGRLRTSAIGAGLLTVALIAVTGYMDEVGSAAARAEARVDALTASIDETTPEGLQESVSVLTDAWVEAANARDSYWRGSRARDVANTVGQAFQTVNPFAASGLMELNAETQALSEEILRSQTVLDNYNEVVRHLGIELGLTEDQTTAFLAAQHPELIEEIGRIYDLMPDKVRENAALIDTQLSPALVESYNNWQDNGEAGEDFGTTLRRMADPIVSATGQIRELTEAEQDLKQAMQDILTVDFGQVESEQQGIFQEFRSQVQAMEQYAGEMDDYAQDVAEARDRASGPRARGEAAPEANLPEPPEHPGFDPEQYAINMLEAGRITQETFDEMIAHMHDGDLAWEEFTGNHQLSLEEYTNNLNAATMKLAAWQQNLLTITGRITEPGQADTVISWLQSMGEEGVAIAQQLATATPEQFQNMVDAISTNVEAGSDPAVVAFQGALDIMEEMGRQTGEDTGYAIAEGLGVAMEDVRRVALQYGTTIASALNPLIIALGGQRLNLQSRPAAITPSPRPEGFIGPWVETAPTAPLIGPPMIPFDPNRQTLTGYRAQGGYQKFPQHAVFQHAVNGGLINWAEPSTHGEWFIPANRSERSQSVLGAAAQHMGYDLVPMADGGHYWNERPMVAAAAGGVTRSSVDRSQSHQYRYEFSGDMYLSDAQSVISFADRKTRMAKLTGRD